MKSFFSRLLVVLVFGLLPAVSGFLVIGQLLQHRENNRVEAIERRLSEQLVQVADANSVESFYFALCNRLFARLQKNGPGAGEPLAAGVRTAQKLWNSELTAFYFNERGVYQALPGYTPANRFIVGKIWDILAETDAYRPGDEQRQQKLIQTLLGSEANAGNLKKLEGQLVSLKKKRMSGYLYWNRLAPDSRAGVLIIVFPLLPTHEILSRRHALSLAGIADEHAEQNYMQLAFWSHEATEPLFVSDARPEYMSIRARMESSASEFFMENGRAWRLIATPAGVFLGSLPAAGRGFIAANGMLNLLMAAALALCFGLILNPGFNPQRLSMKIGNKLLAIFLVAIVFPSGGLLLIGVVAIDAHGRVLLSRLEKDQITRLSAIEDDFSQESDSFKESCLALKQKIIKNYSYAGFVADCQKMIEAGQAVRIELRSLDGERIHLAETGGWFAGLDKSQDAFGRHQIIKTQMGRAEKEKIKVKRVPDAVLTDAFSSDDFGFVQITRAPNRVLPFRFGANELYWFWAGIETPGHPAALLNVYQARNVARERFLRRVLRGFASQSEKLGVYDQNRRIWLNPEIATTGNSEAVIRAAIMAGRPAMQAITGSSGRRLALAFPGTVLAPFSLMLLTDEKIISDRISTLYFFLLAGIFMIIATAFLIARLLTETFLNPVEALDRGMLRIQQRRPDARVAIDSGDEFGELALTFNQMVDDLNEMQLAKTVQDALFPQKKLEIAGYDTAVYNRTATDLGGDYSDYVQVNAHQYLFLIGDVSGHGTPAALCMALVKAAVFKACRTGFEFAALPGLISSLILQVMQRKKMMTMLFVLLDTLDNSVSLINYGHNWPLIIRQDGSVEEIKLGGLPMGMRVARKPDVADRHLLQPGDIFFTYTDALIECLDPAGVMLGHEPVYRELRPNCRFAPDQVVAHIEAYWQKYQAGGIQQDDLTMMVITRDALPGFANG